MAYTYAGQYGPEVIFGQNATTKALTYPTSCAVYNSGTSVLATLYPNRTKTGSLANPLPTGVADGAAGISGTGNVMFFAAPGQYELLINGVGNKLKITVGPDPADGQSLAGLTDFAGSPADGQALAYNSSTGKWGPVSLSAVTPTNSTQLTDFSYANMPADAGLRALLFRDPADSTTKVAAERTLPHAATHGTGGSDPIDGVGIIYNADKSVQWRLIAPDTDATTATPILLRIGAAPGGGTDPGTGGGGGTTTPGDTTITTSTLVDNSVTGSSPGQFTFAGSGTWTYAPVALSPATSTGEQYNLSSGATHKFILPTGYTGLRINGLKESAGGKIDWTLDGNPVSPAGATISAGTNPTDAYSATQVEAALFQVDGLNKTVTHTLIGTTRSDHNGSSTGTVVVITSAEMLLTTATGGTGGTGGAGGLDAQGFDPQGVKITSFTVTHAGAGDTASQFTAAGTVTTKTGLVFADCGFAVRAAVSPVDSSDLDFPHFGPLSTVMNVAVAETADRQFVAAADYYAHFAYQINDVWYHHPGLVPFTVTTGSTVTVPPGSNPILTVGGKSGLTWNDMMVGGDGGGGGSTAQRTTNETGRGKNVDLYASVFVGDGGWGDIAGLVQLDNPGNPKDRPTVIGTTPFPPGGTWAAAAAGTYNSYYYSMGQAAASKNGGYPVVIRFAWEWNGNWYDHSAWGPSNTQNKAQVSTSTFITAWRNAYTQIKAGAGAHPERALVNWSLAGVDAKDGNPSPFSFWPGDAYVDIVGVDIYDYGWLGTGGKTTQGNFDTGIGAIWNTVYTFANPKGKFMAIDEYGCDSTADGGPGDNPNMIQYAYTWIRAHKAGLAYVAYFQISGAGPRSNFYPNTEMLNARARYKLELAAG
jgi:hypothetical protein